MKFVFAAGDVGGARAVLPLAKAAWQAGHEIHAHANGIFQTEGQAEWNWHSKQDLINTEFWTTHSPDHYIYATSVADPHALDISRLAKGHSVPTLHVLDNWSNYADRFVREGQRAPYPDYYAVMDELAYEAAKADGIPKASLIISGHPNLAHLGQGERPPKFKGAPKNIVFVSEPASIDNASHKYRGYDEDEVTSLVCHVLGRISPDTAGELNVKVAAHPREDLDVVTNRWKNYLDQKNGLKLDVVHGEETRQAMFSADYVIGMSSILLYEAWILGKEVISIQPNLVMESLSSFMHREGVEAFISSAKATQRLEDIFIHGKIAIQNQRQQNDLNRHKDAAHMLLKHIESIGHAVADQP